MAFKFVVFLASLAVASAGYLEAGHAVQYAAPVAHYSPASSVSYSTISQAAPAKLAYAAPVAKTISYAAPQVYAAPVAKTIVSSPAVGATHESTIRSHDGTISHYSKAVDTAFSSVRKSDTRITNELPKLAYAQPVLAKQVAYAAPAVHTTYAAPAVHTSYAHAAPAVTYAHAAPAVHTTYAAPAVHTSYSHAAPAVHTTYAAPAVQTYAAHAAPVVATATKTLTYSPAVQVAHTTYEDAHAHYAW
uniref:Uncharacterized protein n=1 Tax=Anopheles funestus TaxID=62324 RepID=A0A182RW21_ANOFN